MVSGLVEGMAQILLDRWLTKGEDLQQGVCLLRES